MTLRVHIEQWGEPNPRKIALAVEILHKGGVAAYPTDSIYALGCAIESRDAIERIFRARNMRKNQRLALICPDLSTASEYAIFSQTANVEFDCSLDSLFDHLLRLSHGKAAGKIRHIGAPAFRTLFKHHSVFFHVHSLRPACSQMRFKVFGGTSSLGWPATVTLPNF